MCFKIFHVILKPHRRLSYTLMCVMLADYLLWPCFRPALVPSWVATCDRILVSCSKINAYIHSVSSLQKSPHNSPSLNHPVSFVLFVPVFNCNYPPDSILVLIVASVNPKITIQSSCTHPMPMENWVKFLSPWTFIGASL